MGFDINFILRAKFRILVLNYLLKVFPFLVCIPQIVSNYYIRLHETNYEDYL